MCNIDIIKKKIVYNKNIDIKFNAHNTFLEKPSSGTVNIEILEIS